MLIHLLGGGFSQITTARKVKEMGHTLLISDYYPDAPAKKYADFTTNVSTFDIGGITRVSREYNIDGILTTGTDQPVFTAASAAEELGLYSYISRDTALSVTNKRVMKPLIEQAGIPNNPFTVISRKDEIHNKMAEYSIKLPAVIKPVDSQGQRGVLKVDREDEITGNFDYAMQFSRDGYLLVEEYYPSDEITISGWLQDGRLTLLAITDRVTADNFPHIGVCYAHRYPSKYRDQHYREILAISEKIASTFAINEGPLYIQMLIGENGIRVNEIACRIGGAYEDEAIPLMTGIDIADMLISGISGQAARTTDLRNFNLLDHAGHCMVLLFFTQPGNITSVGDFREIRELPGVHGGAYQVKAGDMIHFQENATQRAGYVVISADTETELQKRVYTVYNRLEVLNEQGENMVIILPEEKLF